MIAGNIQAKNKNYGKLSPSGPLILPEGEDLILELRKPPSDEMVDVDADADAAPRSPGRPRNPGARRTPE